MIKLNKQRVEELLEVINNKQDNEDFTSEELFGTPSVEMIWDDVTFQTENLLKEFPLKKSTGRQSVYVHDKMWKTINVGGLNGSCFLKNVLHTNAENEGHKNLSSIPYKVIIEEALYSIDKFKENNEKVMEGTRYSKYLFPNGTLYYDSDSGSWDFRENHFDPKDDIREEENPMFPYDFVESSKGIKNLYKVFLQWGVSPRMLMEFITYFIFQREDYENKILYLLGGGSNGKSMLIKLIEALFPNSATTQFNVSKITLDKDGSEALEHSYVNISSEVKFTDFDTTTLKAITGGDTLTVNVKYEKPIKFNSTAKMVVSANSAPHLLSTAHGDLRRFVIMDFKKTFPKKNKYFETELQPYVQALFYKCLTMSASVKQRGIRIEEKVLNKTRNIIKEESNSVYNFIEEFEIKYDIQSNHGEGWDGRPIYTKYSKWCRFGGKKPYAIGRFFKQVDTLLEAQTKIPGTPRMRYLDVDKLNKDWVIFDKHIQEQKE